MKAFSSKGDISFLLIFSVVLTLVFFRPVYPILIIILLVYSLYASNGKVQQPGWISILCLVFFALNLSYLFVGAGFLSGLEKLSTKLSFLVFPAIYMFSPDKNQIKKGIKQAFLYSGMLVSILLPIVAMVRGGAAWNSGEYSLLMHSSYISLLLIASGIFLWTEKEGFQNKTGIQLGFTFLFLLNLFFIRSMGSIFCLVLLSLIVPVYLGYKKKKPFYFGFPLLFLGLVFSAYKFLPPQYNDFQSMSFRLGIWYDSPDKLLKTHRNIIESNTVRLVSWTLSAQEIKKEPLGNGLGSAQERLNQIYVENGYSEYAKRNFNSHNQFLTTGIQMGIVGMLLLFTLMVLSIFYAVKGEGIGTSLWLICLWFSCFFESLIEREIGVLFLVLTLSLVFNQNKKVKLN